MQYISRVGLFLLVNLAVVFTITIVLDLIGFTPYLSEQGINAGQLAFFCFIWGMVGSLVSLFLSKSMAKRGMGLQTINLNTPSAEAQEVYKMIEELSRKANLPNTPEVAIWDSPVVNAFATGPSQSNALVAVSTGLLARMHENEAKAVLAHEITHIKNGDMVTMTLLQGIVNAFVLFASRIISMLIVRRDKEEDPYGRPYVGSYAGYSIVTQTLQFVLMSLGSLIIAWFSRTREFKADEGGASLAGRENMIQALQRLEQTSNIQEPQMMRDNDLQFQSMMISSPSRLAYLFASHPPLEVRIAHLREVVLK